MADPRVDEIVRMEQAITAKAAEEAGIDESNVAPGSWVMLSAIASTLSEGKTDEAMDMLVATQRMIAEELLGLSL